MGASPSASPSASESASPSASESPSPSASPSASLSASPSASPSATPSEFIPALYGDVVLLFDIELDSATKYVATEDFYYNGQKYLGCVIPQSFSISRKEPDFFYGIAPPAEFSFSMQELTDDVNTPWIEVFATDEFRGRWIKVQRYTETEGLTFVGYSRINEASFDSTVEISTGITDRMLEKLIPVGTITTDLGGAGNSDTGLDIGNPINICFGLCRDVPLYNIRWDHSNHIYDWLIGYGPIQGVYESIADNFGVKRNGVLCASSLASNGYAVYTGSAWIRGSGGADEAEVYGTKAFIRFFNDQTDFHGVDTYTADVRGLTLGTVQANRSFATCCYNLLTNATWGLGDDANAASFTAAGSTLSTANGFFCDGAITSQEAASSIIDALLMPMRSYLQRNESKEWEITVMEPDTARFRFGFNDGHYNNIVSCGPMKTIPADSIISTITAHYDLGLDRAYQTSDEKNRKHFAEITHEIDADFGIDQVFELRFVREEDTAVKFVSWITNNMIYSNVTMDLTLDMSGREVRLGDVLYLDIPQRYLQNNDWRVCGISYNEQDVYKVTVRPHDNDMFNDVAMSATSAWSPSYWYSGIYEVPYVTVSPIPGEAMFQTIEDAVDNLPAWARRIVLLKGLYELTGPINFPDRDLEIVGESKLEVVVENNDEDHCFVMEFDDRACGISNMSIISTNATSGSHMIHVDGDIKLKVDNVYIDCQHVDDVGIYVTGMSGDSAAARITDCEILDGTYGVQTEYCALVYITRCSFESQVRAMYIYYCENVSVIDNSVIEFSNFGISVYYSGIDYWENNVSPSIIISNNRVFSTVDECDQCIHVDESTKASVLGNYCEITVAPTSNTAIGIYFVNSTDSVVNSNTVKINNDSEVDNFGICMGAEVDRVAVNGNYVDMVAAHNEAGYKDYNYYFSNTSDACNGKGNVAYQYGVICQDVSGNNTIEVNNTDY